TKRVEYETWVRRNLEIGGSHGRSKSQPDHYSQPNQARGSNSSSDAAQIINPLSDPQANNIQDDQHGQQRNRRGQCERFIIRQRVMSWPEYKNGDAHEIQHHRRNVEHVVSPIAPTRKKSVEITEDFFGPKVNSTFSGITVSQFDYGDGLRPEEQRKRDDPQPH